MLMFPEVLKKAQEEVDRVVGCDRMPEFHDKEQLLYVTAVINETLRYVFAYSRLKKKIRYCIVGGQFQSLAGRRMLALQTTNIKESTCII